MKASAQENLDHGYPNQLGSEGFCRRRFLTAGGGAVLFAAVLGGARKAGAQERVMDTPDWRTLKPGEHDSDLYTGSVGYEDDTALTWWDGRNVAGVTIGLIQFRANLPMMPGNMGNATTFDFPMLYREMDADNRYDIMADQPTESFTAASVEAAKWLELQGVRAIMGNCGFFGTYQKAIQSQIRTPFFSSSLMQLPMIVQSMPGDKKVGVITANGPVLKRCTAIENCGLSPQDKNDRILIEGCESGKAFKDVMELTGKLNPKGLEKEIVAAVRRVMKKDPDIGAILLECTELSPHAVAVQEAVRLPVWDYTTLTNWIHSGAARQPFKGLM